jgi:leucyl-tRNA synthetase
MANQQYVFSEIEEKWQKYWEKNETFAVDTKSDKKKYYVLDMFPYPSGNGLHVGHAEGYTATDIVARYKRMNGFNVLHPMGWDAFGLPAEQYAVKHGIHPKETTATNIKNYKRQINGLGYSTDWNREINTTDPSYYKWTQWIFSKLYEKGLAYESYASVNWCPALGTVLANEEVIDGRSEVGDFPVEQRPLRQWVLKITAYAQRLLDDLEDLDWPESTKEMQRNWIGRSEGAEIDFPIDGHEDKKLRVYSTRPDTIFGATFCVIAPEHPLVDELTTEEYRDFMDEYIEEAKTKSDMSRTAFSKEKRGVRTGAFAINPLTKKKIPIFVADYVLMTYGHGAIMAVPGHDERDHLFAKKYDLEIPRVLTGGNEDISAEPHVGDGTLINSDFLDGLKKDEAIKKIIEWLESNKLGHGKVNYKLRDWIFSRQRYWGEPFPLAHDKDGNVILVDEADLPVTLPAMDEFKPSENADPPLSRATEWRQLEKNGVEFLRETNIMPQWAGSCWYYLRYLDPKNEKAFCDPEIEKKWMPVDLYVGGVEHANLHLLYARFWHKVLYDLGYVSTKEPFKRVVHQGLILGSNSEKMSKSRGNVVNPDDVIAEWGADSLRLFEMFLGPLEQVKPWQTNSISGVHRFLKRTWRLVVQDSSELHNFCSAEEESAETKKQLHRTIQKVTEDTEGLRFNTAIATMMEFVNYLYKAGKYSKQTIEQFVLLLSPYAPHFGEELWSRLGNADSNAYANWPSFDPALVKEDAVKLAVMVNGKNRGLIEVSKQMPKDEILAHAKSQDFLAKYLSQGNIVKEIYVPGKIVNFVVK